MHVPFTESWNNFVFQIFHIFIRLVFLLQYYESVYAVGTLWAQLSLQFWTDPFETLQVF